MQQVSYEHLAKLLASHLSPEEMSCVEQAYEVARQAHLHQVRDEGTPYIVHPLRVAISIVEEMRIHSPTLVCAALLHDVIEDSPTTREEIAQRFGGEVAEVVWLLTKFDDTSLEDYLRAIEDASQTGAPIVKLCDRLDNLRHVFNSPKLEKKRRYLHTTERLYLPMAERASAYLYAELSLLLDRLREHIGGLA